MDGCTLRGDYENKIMPSENKVTSHGTLKNSTQQIEKFIKEVLQINFCN